MMDYEDELAPFGVDTYAFGIKNDAVNYIEPIYNDFQTKALNFKTVYGDKNFEYYKVGEIKGSLHIQYKDYIDDAPKAEGDEYVYRRGLHIEFRDFKFNKFYVQETTNYGNYNDESFNIDFNVGAFNIPSDVQTKFADKN